jgi:uncharacterized protein YbjT (DUF2867 family)
MQKTESVFVTGATGNQGGAAVRHLLSKGFHIKALVRNPDAIPAQLIRQNNVEIIKGDLNDPASYRHHLQNLHAVFCNLQFTAGVNKEVQQGLNLVDNCKEQGVKHLIYSSVVVISIQASPIGRVSLKLKNISNQQVSILLYYVLPPFTKIY